VAWPPLAEQIETGDFVADISRIRDEIGWSPAIPLREGLEQTASFYRARVPS
jgi:nucleoside-diphosphate-sugar epimerase